MSLNSFDSAKTQESSSCDIVERRCWLYVAIELYVTR